MKTIKVEKVYSKEITYKKDGKDKSFMKYAVMADNTWYTLKGQGKENVKQGDFIKGDVEDKEWESNGKSGVEHILTLVDPMIAGLLERLDRLEKAVFKSPLKELGDVDDITPDNNDDLPF